MAKELNTRIRLKYDTLADWTANKSVVLLEGEIGLCAVPAITTGTTTTAPTVLFKVGNGSSTWEELPWGAGLAADVPSWAKAATAPADSNTTYKIVQDGTDKHKFTLQSQEKGSTDWATVSTITIPDNDHNDNQTIKIDDVTFNANDVITLVGEGVTISGDKTNKKITFKVEKAPEATTAEKVAKQLKFSGNTSKSYDGSAEVTVSYSDVGADGAGTAQGLINALDVAAVGGSGKYISTISQTDGKVSATAADMPTALKNPNALTFGTKTYDGSSAKTITAADLGLSGAMHFLGISTTEITKHGAQEPTIGGSAITPSEGDVVLYDHKEYVWAKVGTNNALAWEPLGDESSYALKDHTHSITASGSGDSIITVTPNGGNLSVSYDVTHKKARTSATGVGNTASTKTAINGYGASGEIKIPKISVDEYGHTTSVSEETVSITMPSAPSIPVATTASPADLAATAAVGTSAKYAREDHVHKMPSLDEIQANTKNNYVVFYCGTSSDLV